LRRVISALALAALLGAPAGADEARAKARSAGGDRATALRVAEVLFAKPLDVQLTKVRCERYRDARFCGLTISGVKFHRRLDTASFTAQVEALVREALAVDPAIAEVDLWATVPADAGKGAIVSGDFAKPTSATVYATTARRGAPIGAAADTFWDPAFRAELARGSNG
jgi:hypothetical protein